MNWLKQNWGWLVIVLLAVLPLTHILSAINIDLSDSGTSWITMDLVPFQGRGHGGLPRVMTGAQMAVKETGEWAIRWIVAVLSLTPFTILTGIKSRFHVRQAMGITAFTYAFLHLIFFCVDKGWMEIFKETGFVFGLAATLMMMVLAFTSNRRAMKFLRKTWKKIHRMAYFAGVLAVLHVVLLEHGDWVPYGVILVVGFMVRTPFVKNEISRMRNRRILILSGE